MNESKITKGGLLIGGFSLLGSVGGIVYAVKRKSGFLGGLGWFLLGSFAGTAIGYISASFINYDNSNTDEITDTDVQNLINAGNNQGFDWFQNLNTNQVRQFYIKQGSRQDVINLTNAINQNKSEDEIVLLLSKITGKTNLNG